MFGVPSKLVAVSAMCVYLNDSDFFTNSTIMDGNWRILGRRRDKLIFAFMNKGHQFVTLQGLFFILEATFVDQAVTHTGLIKWIEHAYFVLCMQAGVKPACDLSVTLFTSRKRIYISTAIWTYYTSSWH